MGHREALEGEIKTAQQKMPEISKLDFGVAESMSAILQVNHTAVLATCALAICQELDELTDAVQSLEETVLSLCDAPASAKKEKKRAR